MKQWLSDVLKLGLGVALGGVLFLFVFFFIVFIIQAYPSIFVGILND